MNSSPKSSEARSFLSVNQQVFAELATFLDFAKGLTIGFLEVSFGTDELSEYPPVLQDLNFVRDAYSTSVPYPILFVLPDYAITRIAKYAPDFWAGRSGVFTFKTLETNQKD
jgi:hypothetical protein